MRRALRHTWVLAAALLILAACVGDGGGVTTVTVTTGGQSPSDSPPTSSETSSSSSSSSTTTPTGSAIVSYDGLPSPSLNQSPVNATFTNEDGSPETQEGVTLPWSATVRVPAGTEVSLSVVTEDLGHYDFGCRMRLNGRAYEAQAKPLSEGNEITGYECYIPPVTAKSNV